MCFISWWFMVTWYIAQRQSIIIISDRIFARKIRHFFLPKFSLRISCQEACWNRLRLGEYWISSPACLGETLTLLKVPPIFKHFLIELKCWNFRCGLGPPFCMPLFFSNFWNYFTSPPSAPLTPTSQILHILCDFDEI